MSNYRDDSQDTAIASDFTWANLSALLEDSARAAVVLLATIGVLHQDAALAADEVIDQPLTMRPITCPRCAKLDRSPAYA